MTARYGPQYRHLMEWKKSRCEKNASRRVIEHAPIACKTVDPADSDGSRCNTASTGYRRCYIKAQDPSAHDENPRSVTWLVQ